MLPLNTNGPHLYSEIVLDLAWKPSASLQEKLNKFRTYFKFILPRFLASILEQGAVQPSVTHSRTPFLFLTA